MIAGRVGEETGGSASRGLGLFEIDHFESRWCSVLRKLLGDSACVPLYIRDWQRRFSTAVRELFERLCIWLERQTFHDRSDLRMRGPKGLSAPNVYLVKSLRATIPIQSSKRINYMALLWPTERREGTCQRHHMTSKKIIVSG